MVLALRDLPVSIDRLIRQIRRLDAEYAGLKGQLAVTEDEPTALGLQRRMAALKNRRVTLAGEIAQWLPAAPGAQRTLVEEALGLEF